MIKNTAYGYIPFFVHAMKINFKSNLMGRMFHKIIWLFLLISLDLSANVQKDSMNIIQIKFEGKEYNELVLRLHVNGDVKYFYKGETIDGASWTFSYPDSLYMSIKYVDIA